MMLVTQALGFGSQILNFTTPALLFFTQEGVAPLLAFTIIVITLLIALWVYLRHVLTATLFLKKAAKIVANVKTPKDFADHYDEIDRVFSSESALQHSWIEFKETLIPPDDFAPVFRNTVRPAYFLNISQLESALSLKGLHFISNLLIGVGLLLTFLGLVAALTQAGLAISQQGADIQEPIKQLLKVAAFKFWTSVSGLGSSILLRVFYEFQHSNIKNLLGKINCGLERGLQFITPEYIASEQLKESREQSAAMKRFSTDLAVSLAKEIQPIFANVLAPMHESLKDIGQRITGGIGTAIKDAAGSEMQAISNNLNGIVQSLNNSRSEMDNVASTIRTAMTEAAEALRASAGAASGEMSQQLRDVMTTLAEESRKQAQIFDASMKKLSGVFDNAGEAASGEIINAAQNLATGMNGVSDGVRDAAGSMAERMNHLSAVLKAIEERMGAHVQAMDSLTNRANDAEKAMGATSKHLTDAAIPVTQASDRMATTADQLNQSVQSVRQVITDTHQNLALLGQKMSETQNVLQTSWQTYDKRFGQVDESLARAVHGIVENVNNSIESLSKFVGTMDKNLGDAVKNFAQNIAALNDTAEDFEKASSGLASSVNRMTETRIAIGQ